MTETTSTLEFTTPPALADVQPPEFVLRVHRLGELALLGGGSDELLSEHGLSEERINRSLAADREATAIFRSSRAGTTAWIDRLRAVIEHLDEDWRLSLCLAWTRTNSFLEPLHLTTGPTGARLGALLYLSGSDSPPADAFFFVDKIAQAIASERPTKLQSSALSVSSAALRFWVGAHTAGAGTALVRPVTNWVDGKVRGVDGWVENLALRAAIAMQFAESDPTRVRQVAEHMRLEANELTRGQQSVVDGSRVRLMLYTYRELLSAVESSSEDVDTESLLVIPDLRNLRLNTALSIINSFPVEVIQIDPLRPSAEARVVMMSSNWVVIGQSPAPDTPVRDSPRISIAYAKPGETVPPAKLAARLEESLKTMDQG